MIADRAQCTVWELQEAPSWWVERVRLALVAENGAAAENRKRQERQAKAQRTTGGR